MSESKTDSVTTVPVMEQRGGNKTDRGFPWIVCFARYFHSILHYRSFKKIKKRIFIA